MALPVGVVQLGTFKGAKGDQGPKGDTGSLAFATADTVSPGSPATVTMVGPESNRGAHFEIPQGLPGVNALDNDAAVASYISSPTSDTSTALNGVLVPRDTLNILDYGVETGTAASQTVAIKAALDGNPGRAFYFPPGDYRLDTMLVIREKNSLILDPDARIYAASAMDSLIDYSVNSLTINGMAWSKCIIGGTLDGNLNADNILKIQGVVKFALENVVFRDGINKGLYTLSPGAEIFGKSLHFYNTTENNWDDNVALWSGMGDCHYSDVVVKDWTVGFHDASSTKFVRCHPWLSNNDQLANRYPTSIAFSARGNMDLIGCYSDTYRIALQAQRRVSDNAPARVRSLGMTAYWAGANLPEQTAIDNPGYVINMVDDSDLQFDHNWLLGHGHTGGEIQFATGNLQKVSARDNRSLYAIGGPYEYRYGIQEGVTTFEPTVYGSTTPGTPTYNSRSGVLHVNNRIATWRFQMNVTFDGTVDGTLRLGNFPFPTGANFTGVMQGFAGLADNIDLASFAGGSVSSGPIDGILVRRRDAGGGTTGASVQSQTVEFWGVITSVLTLKSQS